jgi:hypothetical protein
MAVLCSLLFVFVVACGDDDEGNNGGTGQVDAGQQDTGTQQDTGGADAGQQDTGAEEDTGAQQDTGGTGACAPADPSPFTQAECSVLCQDCTDEAAGCVFGLDGQQNLVAACQPAGTGTQNEPCSAVTDCAEGFACVGPSAEEQVCSKICRPDSTDEPQCPTDGTCLPLQDVDGVGACLVPQDACAVFPNDDCSDAAQSCTWTPSGNQCVTFDSAAAAGDTCADASECNESQVCTNIGQGQQCYNLCDPQADPANSRCGEGFACGGIAASQGAEPLFFACVPQG